MANNKDSYISPLSTRYASAEMQHIFSENFKFRTWRRLWIALARAEQALGLDITDEQIAEMEAHKDDINYDVAAAREKAAVIVNPPGCSEHNCGLAADLNSPEHTTLDTGFADTAAFRWLCENAEQYGFILRYPKEAESVTGITYEPWHWRYVGAENAALLNQSGLCLEDAIAVLQRIAAGETVTG